MKRIAVPDKNDWADEARAPYEPEVSFYATVASGDTEKTECLCKEPISKKQGLGILSRNPITSLKYHLAITISMIARNCIERGMDLNEAYGLSDFYIQQMDACNSPSEIDEVHRACASDYARRMKGLHTTALRSAPVARCVDYIHANIHERITLDGLAGKIGISPSYLSRLFHSETGLTISEYIKNCRMDAAKQMLETTDYSVLDIAYIISYPSQSHFTEVFRKTVGIPPARYRREHLRKRSMRE